MLKTLLTLVTIGLVAITIPALRAQHTTNNLTSTVYDCSGPCNGTNQLLMRSDDYNGTGFATYTTSCYRGNCLSSNIGPNGNWVLLLGGQSSRTLWITPNDPPPSPAPATYYWEKVEAYSQCYDQNQNIVPFPSLVNGSNNCSLGVDFVSGGVMYKLVMSPNLPEAGPATGVASVVCSAVSSNQCVKWTISPNPTASNPNVANLYRHTPKGSVSWVFIGQYRNTFLIQATNP